MLDRDLLQATHRSALDWEAYLATDPERADRWREYHQRVGLSESQASLLASFERRMPVLCISGTWCGDCVQQGALLQRIAEACECIDLRWIDRDEHEDLARSVRINAGNRVPVVIFMAEDHEVVSIEGDRPLSTYRAMAAEALGATCPVTGAPVPDERWRADLQHWLDEFERVQLLLRLSSRLRALHGD